MSVKTELQPHLQLGLSDFVASPEKKNVPNHLLDTKIFSGISDNELFHCRPSAIHFKGFVAGKGKYTQKLKIINVSSECQRVHVIPPSSSHFKIKYNKVDSLVPGMYLDVLVEFLPRENVYHYDCIRIHCKGSRNNLTVPIHAYLTMDLSSFPSNIHFKPTQVGHTSVKKIPLKNNAPIDFDFQISILQSNVAFQISPLSGIVPANREVEILVKYSPSEYCTSCSNIQLVVSQFNCQPHHCYITGTCEPGLATKLKVKQMETMPKETLDPRSLSPMYRSQARKQNELSKSLKKSEPKEIVQDGIRFPLDLSGHSAVTKVLSQKPGKLKAKDLRDAVTKGKGDYSSKQMKEAVFEHLVSKNVSEEERNQLRWGVKLGDCSMSDLHKQDVANQRHKSADEYQLLKGENQKETKFSQQTVQRQSGRIHREANVLTSSVPTFDLFLNNDWQKRHMILGKFIQAARKTIWIARAQKGLKAMNSYLQEWRSGNFKNTTKTLNEDNREMSLLEQTSLETLGTKLYAFSYPKYVNKAQDDMAVDALGLVPVNETVIVPKTKVCMYDLEVPLQYKLLHYNVHPFSSAVRNYVPNKLARKLKTGSQISAPLSTPSEAREETVEDEENVEIVSRDDIKPKVPAHLLEPKSYHEMFIFNPLPGVRAHPEKIPYSEIDDDYALTPLSRAVPKALDREGIIPGVMNWKKFPNHGLVAMNTPSLYHVYVPRWSDPFSEELLPAKTPELLTTLDPDDVVDEPVDSDEPVSVPNIAMINAEFAMVEDLAQADDVDTPLSLSSSLPSSNNPQGKMGMMSREKMQSELNVYLHKQMNTLGNSVKERVDQMKAKWDLDNPYLKHPQS